MKSFVKQLLRRAGFELHRFSVEQSENGRFIRMLKYNNVNLIFDVGANTGQFGLLLRDFGFDGEIVSFEPPISLAITGTSIDWASTETLPKASGSIEAETTTFAIL